MTYKEHEYEAHDVTDYDLSALGVTDPTQILAQRVREACDRAKQLVIETDRIVAKARAQGLDVPDDTPPRNRVLVGDPVGSVNVNDLIDGWLGRHKA